MLVYVQREPGLHGFMVPEQEHLVAQVEGVPGIRAGVDHDDARLLQQTSELELKRLPQLEIEVHQRLVKHHHAGVLGKRPGNRQTLLLPPGQLRRAPVEQLGNVQLRGQGLYLPATLTCGHAPRAQG